METERLDIALVERLLVPTRARARDLIVRGRVTVDGRVVLKPAFAVGAAAALAVDAEEARMVSRGRLKLAAALAAFGFDPAGATCLDIGASTGGFTELLLERGARLVYAVDVGCGQLHQGLRSDPRVVSLEGLDARLLSTTQIAQPLSVIVADVSFISLIKVLPVPMSLAAPDAWLVALVKPQFECGPGFVSKTGIVRDETARQDAVARVSEWLAIQPGWRVRGSVRSPITGASGNVEFLVGAQRRG